MLYKVTIPTRSRAGYVSQTTLTLPAAHWMVALTLAVEEIGEDKKVIQNITWTSENDEDYVEVTAVDTNRVFIIERYYPEKEGKKSTCKTDPDILPEDTSPEMSAAPRAFKPVDEAESDEKGEEDNADEDENEEKTACRERVDTEQDIPRVTREGSDDSESEEGSEEVSENAEENDKEPEKQVDSGEKSTPEEAQKDPEEEVIVQADTIDIGEDAEKAKAAARRAARKKKKPMKKRTKDDRDLVEAIYFELLQLDELSADLPSLFEAALDLVRKYVDCEIGAILSSDPSGRELYFAAVKGILEDQASKYTIPITDGFFGCCVREGTPFIVNDDPEGDERVYRELLDKIELELDSICCAPILHGARVYGAIGLINHTSGEFITPELTALRIIGESLGEHIYNARMSTELNFA